MINPSTRARVGFGGESKAVPSPASFLKMIISLRTFNEIQIPLFRTQRDFRAPRRELRNLRTERICMRHTAVSICVDGNAFARIDCASRWQMSMRTWSFLRMHLRHQEALQSNLVHAV